MLPITGRVCKPGSLCQNPGFEFWEQTDKSRYLHDCRPDEPASFGFNFGFFLSVAAPGCQDRQIISRSLRSWGRSSGKAQLRSHVISRSANPQARSPDALFPSKKLTTFYSAAALLAMLTAVLATGIPSVCPSVRLSVTFRYCVQIMKIRSCAFQHLVGQSL